MQKKIKTAAYYWAQNQKHLNLADFYSFEMDMFSPESVHYRRAYNNFCYHKRKARDAQANAMAFSNKMR